MKGKYCLESVVPFSGINQSHTNRSSTKQTFSFSKSPRFDSSRGACPVNTYDGKPVQRKNSGAAMGFGNKSDFTKTLTVSPRSTKYEIKSLFDNNKNNRKGYSLRKSREVDAILLRTSCSILTSVKTSSRTPASDGTRLKGNWLQLPPKPLAIH